ncbi:hypothetical protein ASG73_10315 [Janibacter sp. Soil728]|uniref:helix-turn-helix transcriptional regulator n=1 Tax=Janibacter sp. Soil728 TaxID=1736393 RepID=UPI0006F8349E|nr:helix-turn-helix domain-containing protein [Janibacter sp. Soil728]KRE37978.1 hypothetical protein ASG73_10315 [Janibacter sp. Soil728]
MSMDETTTSTAAQVFIRTDALAERWGVSPKTLANLRTQGTGPTFHRVAGGSIRYLMADIEAHERAGRTEAVAV